ncbi:hypothetical protein CANCADRAFT_65940 [Tortispora caseinolytica NRRL Y-17796]|uniref:Sulfhydryl oxidase n=1 Tax=Tortispora caseinolytica NRRL Y-17796 TaxID=767744 RepID=A0A1E4TCB1_9ASCO|nr:hypothetical protein CANCADRAFT_65940 [Tortispora caseinolytica NRRL Y-17796]
MSIYIRRPIFLTLSAVCILGILFFLEASKPTIRNPAADAIVIAGDRETLVADHSIIEGKPIMPNLGNETIKAELGRASWKLFHTILARYPEKPTPEERQTLSDYIHLFSRVYPCGECAGHFQKLLKKFPPQTSSQAAAAQWGCFVHNQVNERLGKDLFNCDEVAELYKCGCDEPEAEEDLEDDSSSSKNLKSARTFTDDHLKDIVFDSAEDHVRGG